jgi:glycogen debranching enzyme
MTILCKDISKLVEACYQCLKNNEMIGYRWDRSYHFYRPSLSKYSASQWLWDSGWHMVVWSYRQPENAIAELRSLLKFQQPNGFIPQIIFWNTSRYLLAMNNFFLGHSHKQFTNLTQMPMLAYSIRALWNATKDKDLLKEFIPKIVKYLEWWKSRDHDNDGLVSIIHPWESGLDASPHYDPVFGLNNPKWYQTYNHFYKLYLIYRKLKWNEQDILQKERFNVEDVGLCSVYADGWGILASLAKEFDSKLAIRCYQQFKIHQNAIIKRCWNEEYEQFISYFHRNGEEEGIFTETVQTLLPILLDDLPTHIQLKLVSKITDPEKFGLPYPIPSVAKSEITFNPQKSRLLWRGPMWPSTTWLIMEGLLKHGFKQEALAILDKWINMYLKHGIFEYYNPISGEGLGQKCLGMSTIIIDMIYRLKVNNL